MQIPDDILAVLTDDRTIISGDRVQIPFQLDDALYKRVNVMLKDVGGRWDGRKVVRAHVFPFPVEEFMRACLAAGEWPSKFEQGWYPTPPKVVFDMLEHASIRVGHTVLEPSAGTGSLAKRAAEEMGIVDCVEIDPRRAHVLRELGIARQVIQGDFLDLDPLALDEPYDRVLMNPPFSNAIGHVMHALGFLKDGGTLVAVMPESITWHTDRAAAEFRKLIADNEGEVIPLPEGAFKPSGTSIQTVLLCLDADPDGTLPTHGWHQRQPLQLDLFATA
ncbi:class I SAM-dependent methyltransferase [Streptomyces afghaniensis]|uniref:class I SAM-dependent methyltransferase n=1 Tax=Streptomyces afghaniensis TaxID=66865 RepID=UPI00277F0AA0|nr:class I SAM-dependent methyltransferase [Streptomyces afghaniensis]MDQ1018887.1 putative RNA methylase [Streptomyces afghaniensis]